MSLDRAKKWYENLPIYERSLPLFFYKRKKYTPDKILSDIKRKTPSVIDFLKKIEDKKSIFDKDADWEIAKKRLIQKHKDRPIIARTLKYNSEDKYEWTSEDFIKEIKKETKIGRSLIEAEIKVMNIFRRGL